MANEKGYKMKKRMHYILISVLLLTQLFSGGTNVLAMEITDDNEIIYEKDEEQDLATIEAYELDELPASGINEIDGLAEGETNFYSSDISFYGSVNDPSSVADQNLDIYSNDYVYQHMTDKQKGYYNQFKKVADSFLYTMEDALPGNYNGNKVYLLGPIECGENESQMARDYARVFIFQNPQYYFLTNKLYYTKDAKYLYLSVYPEFWEGEVRSVASNTFFNKIDVYVEIVKKEKTDYDKHKKAFEIVCNNVKYQFIDGYYDQTAYGAIIEGITVCAGYTKLYEMLTNAVGIPTIGITSPDPNDSEKGLHAWNKVQLDGKWYNVDTTWADTTSSDKEKYLDRSDSVLLNLDKGSGYHSPHSYFTGLIPACPNDYVKDEHPVEPEKIIPDVSVSYRTHVQSYGWQGFVKDGVMSGTSGKAKRLEAIEIKVVGNTNLGIQYTTHCQSYGWMPWSANGDTCGTEGESKRLESIMIQLTGVDKQYYDVYYRVHAQSYGWLAWAKNGAPSGSAGYSKRLEGIQIVIKKKGEAAPGLNYKGITGNANNPSYDARPGSSPVINHENTSNQAPKVPGVFDPNVSYRTHVQTYGWQGWKFNGDVSGTTGLGKRLEGIQIRLTNAPYSGGITYKTHIQSIGWQNWRENGDMAGTSGKAKRLECICIKLTGEMAEYYDVYYRVHSQTYGWLGWAKNGEPAGTYGLGKRLESIQIGLVEKGKPFPENKIPSYISK